MIELLLSASLICAAGANPFPSPTWSVRAVPDGERAAPRLWQGISPKVRAWEKSGRAETLSRVGRGPSLAIDAASCLLPSGAAAAHPAPVFVVCDAAAVPTNALLKRGYAVARGRFCATPAASLVQRPELDATRVAVVGSGDVLRAAAHDERIAMAVAAGHDENEASVDCAGDLLRLMAPRLACPVGVRKDAVAVARDLYAAYGIPERLFAQAAGSPALRPSDWERILDFADRELKAPSAADSDEIERRLMAAVADGSRTLTLGRNAASADGVWRIVRAIRVPDDFTLVLDGCRVELADRTQDNLIRNAGAAEGATKPNRGIRILGKNGAVLSAGVRNHYRPRRSGDPNGWRSVGILLCDVSDYEIGGLRFEETQCWAISQERCHHGRIHDLVFGSTDRFYNQDGVDVRKGCHDLVIENISGAAGDDAVALTALRIPADAPERYGMQIGGNRSRGEPDDVYNVTVRNVRARSSGGHGVIRLLTADGIRMHHIVVSNVVDTASGNEKRPFATIRIGDMNYSTISRCKMGEMHHIAVCGVKASGAVAVSIRGPLCDSSVTDVTPVPGGKRYAVTAPLERVVLDQPDVGHPVLNAEDWGANKNCHADLPVYEVKVKGEGEQWCLFSNWHCAASN